MAARHPASEDETKTQAQQRLAHYESAHSPEFVVAAKQAAPTLDLSVVTGHLLKALSEPFQSTAETGPRFIPKADQPLIEPLSERELEVLHYIAAGLQNREIATKMIVTLSTVKTHINNIYRKLDVTNRVQAVTRSTELGLL
ncbi:response regulator transcription factor [Chloroflexi bacterium TSY]|nr:response regulator transcription factor [Chloroflexi bacterium TSY]